MEKLWRINWNTWKTMILRGVNFEYSFSLGLILFFFPIFLLWNISKDVSNNTVTATWFFRTWDKTHSSNPPVIVQLVKIKGLQRDRYLIPEEFDSEKFYFGVTFSLKFLLQLKTTSQYLVCTLWRCQRKELWLLCFWPFTDSRKKQTTPSK